MPDQPIGERIAEVLVYHQRKNASGCICGWAELGKSHPAHQAAAVAGIVRGAQAEALREAADDFGVNLTVMSGPRIRTWLTARADRIEKGKA